MSREPGTRRRFPITLAMVAYHKADVIGLVVDSAARSSMPPDLVVVSDDGSTDGTGDVAEETCRRHGIAVRILRHPRVGTYRIQAMRNSAAAASLDGMILLSDSDCILGRYTLEAHYRIHERFPDAIGTGARFEYLEGTSGDFTSMYSTLEFSHCPVGNYMVPYGANMSFTKRMWRWLGGFDRAYDGNYGFEDHEFLYRAQLAGAVTYSDPAAHLFHCPHETVFGHRDPSHNVSMFNNTFSRSYGHEEWMFLRETVLPSYWRGHRKETLLGPGRLELDRWGAPPGYHPPPHLALVESLEPIVGPVRRLFEAPSEERRRELRDFIHRIQLDRVLPHSPAESLVGNLRWIVDSFDLSTAARRDELTAMLDRWLQWQRAVDHRRGLANPAPSHDREPVAAGSAHG